MGEENNYNSQIYNCTKQLLQFQEFANLTSYLPPNRTTVYDVLQSVVKEKDDRIPEEIKKKANNFLSTCFLPAQPTDLVWWQKLLWTTVFAIMLVIATGGNAIVMWIVLAHKRMRTVTNYFLVNLSISDLIMSLLNCICNSIFMINSDWPFGSVYCTLNNFVSAVSVAAGVFTLMAISFDRYMAIVKPLQHRISHRKARIALAVIWVASAILGVPPLIFSTTMTKRYADGQTRIICYLLWPDGAYPTSVADYIYNVVFLGVTYLMPMTMMGVCYTLMGIELWGSKSIGEFTQRQVESVKSKRKVVRMFIIVVAIFAFCWLPYHGYFIYAYHNNAVARSTYVQHMFLFFYWLAMSNAMVNPIIYYWMNARFRMYFQRIICCCCSRSKRRDNPPKTPKPKGDCTLAGTAKTRTETVKLASITWHQKSETIELAKYGTCDRENLQENCLIHITTCDAHNLEENCFAQTL